MKTILNFLAAFTILAAPAVFAQQAPASLPAQTANAVKAQTDKLNSADESSDSKTAAVQALVALAQANPTLAAQITATAIANLGGNAANQTIVTQLMTAVVTSFSTQPDIANSIVQAAIGVAPTLISAISVSAGGAALNNPIQSLLTSGSIINIGEGSTVLYEVQGGSNNNEDEGAGVPPPVS